MFQEDMIDFPCSPAWRDHYFRLGLTPTHSDEFHYSREQGIRLNTLEEDMHELKSLVRGKKVIVQNLVTPVLPKKEKKYTVYESEELHGKRRA